MSDEGADRPSEEQPEPAWRRRQRLAQIFGEVLPEQTSDDATAEAGEAEREAAPDRWLKSQVPPHHG